MEVKKTSLRVGVNELQFETGTMAKQADGAVVARYGDTVVLATAVSSKEAREGTDFFPLTVDVEERMYAAGKIPGGFIKREGRPSEKSTLTARLIDRPIRPLFPEGYRNDVQVIATVLCVDLVNPFDVLALNAASAALTISDIPFEGPIAAVRIGYKDGEYSVNPTLQDLDECELDLVVAGTADEIVMVEAGGYEVSEDVVIEAMKRAQAEIVKIVRMQNEFAQSLGTAKREVKLNLPDEQLQSSAASKYEADMRKALENTEKKAQSEAVKAVIDKAVGEMADTYPEREGEIKNACKDLEKKIVRSNIIEMSKRPDGRGLEDIRPLSSAVSLLPRTHGSGLFTRGQTQVLTICTLGAAGEEQRLDGLGIEESKRFLHHYNFPPFSTGEAGFMRGPKRREIGHGALVEKAILKVMPDEDEFPYTVRLVSEVLESNGSSSMASVCGSSLSLMDAGVPIKSPVAGIAMGFIKEGEQVRVLTDIQGVEDHLGDMDFKVAGTREGITALQMDVKTTGLTFEILKDALDKARNARLTILDSMKETLSESRVELSKFAPRIIILQIDPSKIREVIGPGGKVINDIIAKTGVNIDIEDDGRVYITSRDGESGEAGKAMVEAIVKPIEIGQEYLGKVVGIASFGAFVQLKPGKDGLVHISKLTGQRVEKVEDVVSLGDEVLVEVQDIDSQGKISLKAKNLKPKE